MSDVTVLSDQEVTSSDLESEEVTSQTTGTEADDQEDNEVAPQAEADDQEAVDPEASAEDGDDSEQAEGEEDQAPEILEFNFGGNKMEVPADQVPADLAAKIQDFSSGLWSDYTKGKQEVADMRKGAEAQVESAKQIQGMSQEMMTAYARGVQLNNDIAVLQSADLQSLWTTDPNRARQISDTISQKQAEFNATVNEVKRLQDEVNVKVSEAEAKAAAEGEAIIESAVPGFKSNRLPAVIDHAVEVLGMDRKVAEADWAKNPAITMAVHKARLYDEMMAKANRTTPKPKAAQQTAKPQKGTKRTRAALDLVKDADKMDNDTWQKQRAAELEAKRKAGMR